MKKWIYMTVVLVAVCFACSRTAPENFIIEGEIKGYGDGRMYVVSETLDDYKNDTVFVRNGRFTFRSSAAHPVLLLFMATDNDPCNRRGTYSFTVFAENSSTPVRVEAEVEKRIENAVITGSRLQSEYEQILSTGMVKNLQRTQWLRDSLFKAGDSLAAVQKNKEFELLVESSVNQLLGFDFAPNSTAVVYVLYRHFPFLPVDKLEEILQRLDPEIETSVYLEKMQERTRRVRLTAIGKKAPAFTLEDTSGQKYSLEDFKGKMVLLDFTASWCHWCKVELPFIEKVYEEMEGKDFEIISVYLDQKREEWVKDVQEARHPWKCLSDMKAWKKGGMAYDYYVGGIPELIILDREGKIVSRGTRGEETLEVVQKNY